MTYQKSEYNNRYFFQYIKWEVVNIITTRKIIKNVIDVNQNR